MSTYTHEQLAFINFSGPESIILSAVAGSGKTHSAVGRLRKMLADGIDPKKIIFFSFTNDAVDELKSRIQNDEVRVTTIHSYTSSQLARMGKYKPIATFYEFASWYKEKYKPKHYEPIKKKMAFQETIEKFYEEGQMISSAFSAFKLQTEDSIKVPRPKYYDEYQEFLKETKARDFSDLLIETERLSKNPQYAHFFENTYDYVLIDEYQDTSTLQLKILLNVKAKQYYLIGDKNQSIYGFSGANCDAIEALLRKSKKVVEFNLTMNFRSAKAIVELANNFSELKAIPFSQEEGLVDKGLIDEVDLFRMITDPDPLTILVRTNNVIKELEKECLKQRIPMRYFNFITKQDLEYIKKGSINASIKKKLEAVVGYHGCSVTNPGKLIEFIERHQDSPTFITSIHKSKGREYPRVVVVNSLEPEQLMHQPELIEDYSFLLSNGDIDQEAKNIHYVATSRPKQEIYFHLYEF